MQWSKSLSLLSLATRGAHAFTRSITRHSYTTTTTALAAAAPPTQYLLTYDYIPDVLEKRGPFRAEHLQLAQDAVDAGKCVHGGPKGPLEPAGSPPNGAVFIFYDLESAQDFVNKDPYVSGGIVTAHTIEAWTVAVSKDAE